MHYLRIRNWDQYQHYKDRAPVWIKLYHRLLDDYEFACLPDASKGHLLGLFMLACRLDNKLPADPDWIARRIGATEPVNLELLAHFLADHEKSNGDGHVASRYQDAPPSLAERYPSRGRTRSVSASSSVSVSSSGGERERGAADEVVAVLEAYNEAFVTTFMPGESTTGYLQERLDEGRTLEQLLAVLRSWKDQGRRPRSPQQVFAANNFARSLEELRSRGTKEDFGSRREFSREEMVAAYGEDEVAKLESERGRHYESASARTAGMAT